MAWYSAWLLSVFSSPGTGATFTVMVTAAPRGGDCSRARLAVALAFGATWSIVSVSVIALHTRVEEVAERLDARMAAAEERLDGAIAYRALVRYDAYGELSGHQSTSLALLDAGHSGVVLSSIANRETARIYCKSVHAGQGEHELSPEEAEAIRLALAGDPGSHTLD